MEPLYLSKIDMVTAALRELIMHGEFHAGDSLRQRDLAERFNVSATPVREALRRLESEGLVRHSPHAGVSVVEVDYGATMENFRIRAALEGLAVELAAERVTDEDIEELEELNRQLAAHEGHQQADELNRRLHFRIYELAGSPLLISLLRRLWSSFPLGPQVVRPIDQSIEQHAAIIDALRDRDAAAASALTQQHILEAMRSQALQPTAS
jgi:DNA-binding GntR family transcriptional regulator